MIQTRSNVRRRIAAKTLFVSKTVSLKVVWVLMSVYELRRETVHRTLQRITGLDGMSVEDRVQVEQALAAYRDGADFADALHVASMPNDAMFVSFDRALVRRFDRAEAV